MKGNAQGTREVNPLKHPIVSLIEEDKENICFLCGHYGHMEVHHIFGGSVRQTCNKQKLIVHLCQTCHKNLHDHGESKQYLHQIGQQEYESKIGTRDEFIHDYIRSYL